VLLVRCEGWKTPPGCLCCHPQHQELHPGSPWWDTRRQQWTRQPQPRSIVDVSPAAEEGERGACDSHYEPVGQSRCSPRQPKKNTLSLRREEIPSDMPAREMNITSSPCGAASGAGVLRGRPVHRRGHHAEDQSLRAATTPRPPPSVRVMDAVRDIDCLYRRARTAD